MIVLKHAVTNRNLLNYFNEIVNLVTNNHIHTIAPPLLPLEEIQSDLESDTLKNVYTV